MLLIQRSAFHHHRPIWIAPIFLIVDSQFYNPTRTISIEIKTGLAARVENKKPWWTDYHQGFRSTFSIFDSQLYYFHRLPKILINASIALIATLLLSDWLSSEGLLMTTNATRVKQKQMTIRAWLYSPMSILLSKHWLSHVLLADFRLQYQMKVCVPSFNEIDYRGLILRLLMANVNPFLLATWWQISFTLDLIYTIYDNISIDLLYGHSRIN